MSLNKIGDVKLQAGDQAGALAAYEESLGIRRDLAKDKSNAQAQRDLAFSLQRRRREAAGGRPGGGAVGL